MQERKNSEAGNEKEVDYGRKSAFEWMGGKDHL